MIKSNSTIALDFNANAKKSLDLNQFQDLVFEEEKKHLTKWFS